MNITKTVSIAIFINSGEFIIMIPAFTKPYKIAYIFW